MLKVKVGVFLYQEERLFYIMEFLRKHKRISVEQICSLCLFLYQDERLVYIMEFLRKHKRISVEQICSLFQVSRDTARRDIVKLEKEKSIIRTRGGAILPAVHHVVENYSRRLKIVSEEKKIIGRKASSLIHPDDRIILDTSTTVQSCAEQIDNIDCTVIAISINQ